MEWGAKRLVAGRSAWPGLPHPGREGADWVPGACLPVDPASGGEAPEPRGWAPTVTPGPFYKHSLELLGPGQSTREASAAGGREATKKRHLQSLAGNALHPLAPPQVSAQ